MAVLAQHRSRSWADAFRGVDVVLVAATLALTVIGLFAIYSATHQSLQTLGLDTGSFVKKQVTALAVAVALMAFMATIDYRVLKAYAALFYVGMLLLLVLVQTPLGTAAKGAQRGFYLMGFQFTPSEWTKVALVLMLATYLSDLKRQELFLGDVLRATAMAVAPMFLVFIQPDIGTTIVLSAILVAVLVVAGARARHLGVLALAAVILLAGAFQVGFIKHYQVDRLTAFFDSSADAQGARYNQAQSEIAIGSGGLFGSGYLKGTQTNLDFVPEQHTDFIFTVVGEEFGFAGAVSLLMLYALVLWRAFRIARASKDALGTYIAAGVAAMLAIQMFVNIGMTVGIMPITGIPLPFVSYGGSSLIANFMAVGLLLSIQVRRAQAGRL
jgi:rod shape determining protein RodA